MSIIASRARPEKSSGRRFRDLIARPQALLLPGSYDALSAKVMEQAGFEAVYMSGSAVTSSLLGAPDVGLLGGSEMIEQARRIVNSVDIPVICDADTGYGNVINVRRTIREYEAVGVAGIHLEDQVAPKRCGHFEGKSVISTREMIEKLDGALEARKSDDFVIIARTDARATEGLGQAIARAKAYAKVGADILFVEAIQSVDEMRRVVDELSFKPLFVNVVEGGKTPQLSFSEYERLGFSIIMYPTASIRVVMRALKGLAHHLAEVRSTEQWQSHLVEFEERNRLTGLADVRALEQRYAERSGSHLDEPVQR